MPYEDSECIPEEAPVRGTSRYHRVSINRVENGFIVEVGCKTFVAKDWATVNFHLEKYWIDPKDAEKKFFKDLK